MAQLTFDRSFEAAHGQVFRVSPEIRRITANNPGPFTFMGTNSYILGRGRVAIVDPGPDDDPHRQALLAAVAGESVTQVILTHTHLDHVAGAAALARALGVPLVGAGPHRPARPLAQDEVAAMDASADKAYAPDRELQDGEVLDIDGLLVEAVATPGHTANHLAFALPDTGHLISGDHVMAWSTTIVAPPDGAMADYMASLDRLLARPEGIYLPGHGAVLRDAHAYVEGLRAHRLKREAQVLDRLAAGDTSVAEIVRAAYEGLDPRLFAAAGLSVLAHLEDLAARGLVRSEGPPRVDGRFTLA